ncbi:cell division protein FtsQ/DivIB [Pseudomaricurvus hydrocarbonicus]
MSVVVVACYGGGTWLLKQLDRPVTSVKINGEFTRISQKTVAESVYDSLGDSFMKLDLDQIQKNLEGEAWIDRVRVARRWPDQLEVTIIEHKPIARWGKSGVLNHRGEVIRLGDDPEAKQLLLGLPVLGGVDGMEQEMMARYQTLNKMLLEHNLSLKELNCDATGSWAMTLSDNVVIQVGRDQVLEKMDRFLTVFDAQLQQRWAELNQVDLRYFNGVAVAWRKPDKA